MLIYLSTMKKQLKPANSVNKQDQFFPKDAPSLQESLPFPIAGIGASAGGPEGSREDADTGF
jgi:hypothetical protein